MLWCSGTTNNLGSGAMPIGAWTEGVLLVSGLTPALEFEELLEHSRSWTFLRIRRRV